VVGASGSGKTTLARALARRLELPYVELDAFSHGPDWNEVSNVEFTKRVSAAIGLSAGWVVDGNYERKLGDLVFEQAETVVWLDLPLRTILWRLWGRTVVRIRNGVELSNGNKESWRGAFLGFNSLFAWAVRRHRKLRRWMLKRLAKPSLAHVELVRLRSADETERWLNAQ